MKMNDATQAVDLPRGEVSVTPHGDGWLLVQIGRGRYTKRFNLSTDEAAMLVQEISRLITDSYPR